jgi:hypothetical protein
MTAMTALALRALCFLDRDRLARVPTEDGAKVRCHDDDGYWFLREIVQGAVGMLVKILLIVV